MEKQKINDLVSTLTVKKSRQMAELREDPVQARDLAVHLIQNETEFDRLQEEWEELVKKARAHVFSSHPWQRLWWKYFGSGNKLYLLTFYDGSVLVGVAPFYVDERRRGGYTYYRELRFIGGSMPTRSPFGIFTGYSPSDYLDVVSDPVYEESVIQCLGRYLESKAGIDWDGIQLEDLPEEGLLIRYISRLNKQLPGLSVIPTDVCPAISVDGRSFDDMVQQVESRNSRYNIRRSLRYVTDKKLFNIARAESVEEVEKLFHHFVTLHQRRWNQKGYPGIFDSSEFENYLLDVIKVFYVKGWLWLAYAESGGEIIAVDCSFEFNQRIYNYQKALDDQHELAKYGPGYVLILTAIREIAEKGGDRYEYLRGDEEYKFKFHNVVIRNYKLVYRADTSRRKRWIAVSLPLLERLDNLTAKILKEKLIWNVQRRQYGLMKGGMNYLKLFFQRLES